MTRGVWIAPAGVFGAGLVPGSNRPRIEVLSIIIACPRQRERRHRTLLGQAWIWFGLVIIQGARHGRHCCDLPVMQRGGASTRAQAAALQIRRISSAFSQHPCRRQQHLQPSTPSPIPSHPMKVHNRSGRALAISRCGMIFGIGSGSSSPSVGYRDNARAFRGSA